ncbi:eukaryotic translation initiation factor eIF2A-domain-containing protein [Elsinoe ampelina]|uniref:Eukaryotic translation initiation factor 3 subunit B n=1 Tax=Elsinoe ampelina TaxID=302913 RepID=A0A6A6G8R8_9PEZI|nr:eukaryotic translation initiation factor eIF2A-domain-containing protein [Elsinoe ampelina]
MAPSFDNLPDDDNFDDEEIDFSDLHEQYQVRMEEGLDAFVVCDGLPVVPADSRPKLTKFILKRLTSVGSTDEERVFMPIDEDTKMTLGYAFVEYGSSEEAAAAIKALNLTALDKKHTMKVNRLTDIERYGREGRIDEEYHEPHIEPFAEKEHLRWWLSDTDGRDQFVVYRGDNVGVYWNERDETPDPIVDRQHWTESFVQWSPLGTYLTSMHAQGVQLWGGPSWTRQKRFAHPGVNLVDYSPNEAYLVTWSHKPLQVEEGNPFLSLEEDGKNYIIWDVATGKPLRSFATLDQPGGGVDEMGQPIKKKLQWPAFKWSCDAKYVARMNPGQSISIYELPRMNLLDKTSVKIEGVVDFEWAPANPQRYDNKKYEQLLCFWTPELGSNPAKVALMSIPTKEIVRTRNLFNVTDAKLHWQSESAYVCVKVDRHSKSKKSLATNLEIFRVKEKGVPVEVIDTIKDTVINFAWEPKGDRFVLITAGEVVQGAAVQQPKTAVSFFCPEKSKTNVVGNFRHIRTIDKKNNNAIHWSPAGRFVLVATVLNQQSFDLDFYDFDYEGEREEKDKDLTANLQHLASVDHYGVTDIEWDPSGRFVATSASVWKHRMENGYHLYDFRGLVLREEPLDGFKQFAWRPRPGRLLSKEEQKTVRKNLREYSKQFDEQDLARKNTANRAVVEERRRKLDEWRAWREKTERLLREDRADLGLPEKSEEEEAAGQEGEGTKVVEEIVEEILDETEEVVA